MATPDTLPDTPQADGDLFLSEFHTSMSHAEGTNEMLTDLANAWARIGPGAVPPLATTLLNGKIVASVASNALTVAIKTQAGDDPSATSPVIVLFRSVTAANGDHTAVTLTAATSLVISSGSTLGTANSTPFRLWLVAFNDAGTLRLGVINCRSGATIYPLSGWAIVSSTAEGGAGAADSAQVFYTGTATTSKAYTILGYMTWESGLGTAGTWSAVPTRIELYSAQTPLPGTTVQVQQNATGAVATGNTALPHDDTIPQNTEGNQYMTQAITPTSAANLLEIETMVAMASSITDFLSAALFQDSTAGALAAGDIVGTAGFGVRVQLLHCMLAATTSATTFKTRAGITPAGVGGGGIVTFNGVASGRIFGGVSNSYMRVVEVMG